MNNRNLIYSFKLIIFETVWEKKLKMEATLSALFFFLGISASTVLISGRLVIGIS